MITAAQHAQSIPAAYQQALHQAGQIVNVLSRGSIGSNLFLACAAGVALFIIRAIARAVKRG